LLISAAMASRYIGGQEHLLFWVKPNVNFSKSKLRPIQVINKAFLKAVADW